MIKSPSTSNFIGLLEKNYYEMLILIIPKPFVFNLYVSNLQIELYLRSKKIY